MLDLSTNTELKAATFARYQQPRIKWVWKDGVAGEADYSRFLLSASGTIEIEDQERQSVKNNFNITLANDINDPTLPGNWFPENSGSNGEKTRIELGYEHSGVGVKTVTVTRGEVTQLQGSSKSKEATLYALDTGKDFDMEYSASGLFKSKKPYEIIESLCNGAGYYTTNAIGAKKLIFRSLTSLAVDESVFPIRFYNIRKTKGWDVVNQICEASLGKFFINRSGDVEYWTYNYWANRFSSTNHTADFNAKTLIYSSDTEIVPIFDHIVSTARDGVVNTVDTTYYDFKKEENLASASSITFEIQAGETKDLEINFGDTLVETLDITGLWTKVAFLFDDYSGTDQGLDITINTVTNGFSTVIVNVTNTGVNYLYAKITPQIILQWKALGKQVKLKENGTTAVALKSWADGNFNYNIYKENKKTISNLLVQSRSHADNLNYTYIDLYRKPIREAVIETTGFPQMDMGDIVYAKNYVEYKNTETWGWIKKIDWDFSGDAGYAQKVYMNIMDSVTGLLLQYITDFFDDTTKIDLANTDAIISGGDVRAKTAVAGLVDATRDGFELADTFGGQTGGLMTTYIDTGNTTATGSPEGFYAALYGNGLVGVL